MLGLRREERANVLDIAPGPLLDLFGRLALRLEQAYEVLIVFERKPLRGRRKELWKSASSNAYNPFGAIDITTATESPSVGQHFRHSSNEVCNAITEKPYP